MRILRVSSVRGLAASMLLALAAAVAPEPRSLAGALPPTPTETLSDADEIHWTIVGPNAVTLSWRGDATTVRYGLTTAYGATATATPPVPLPTSSPGPFREAKLTGLLPDAVYHYAIGTKGEDHTFRTPPPAGASDFVVYAAGDIGSSLRYWRVPPVQSLIAAGQPRFVLALGDLTYGNDHGMAVVDQHFNDVMAWSRDAAYMPCWGNHDWEPSDTIDNYKGRFDLPNPRVSPGAPTGGGEDWYWFDYGNVRFIAYPEPWTGAWTDWAMRADALMDSAQADTTLDFIVTFGHRPAYSSGWHAGSATLRSHLDALGAGHSKYVLNLNGHSHNYERSHPQSGVVHVTSGTGGAGLEQTTGSCLWSGGCPPPAWSAFRAMRHGALRLHFLPDRIEGAFLCGPEGDPDGDVNDVVCTPGSVIDAFTIGLPGDGSPVVLAPAQASGTAGGTLELTVTASDPDGDPIASLTADLTGLPSGHGATFAAAADQRSGALTWVPSSAHAGGPYTVRFIATNARSGAATTAIHVHDPGANLAANPSFESNTTGWSSYHAASMTRVAGGHHGGFALRLGAPNGQPATFGVNDSPDWVQAIDSAGAIYRFVAWVRSSRASGRARLQVREWKNGVQQGGTTLSGAVILSASWQMLSVDRTAVTAGSTMDLQVIDEPVDRREEFDVDDVSIRRLSPPASVRPAANIDFAARFVPNPAPGGGVLHFTIPGTAPTWVEILDLQGRRLRMPLAPIELQSGAHALPFDGRDERGARMAPGLYFFRITSGARQGTGRFLVVP